MIIIAKKFWKSLIIMLLVILPKKSDNKTALLKIVGPMDVAFRDEASPFFWAEPWLNFRY